MSKITIAIDGPAAAGKSTIAKLVAKKLKGNTKFSCFLFSVLNGTTHIMCHFLYLIKIIIYILGGIFGYSLDSF